MKRFFISKGKTVCAKLVGCMLLLSSTLPTTAHAQSATADAMFELHPHCIQRDGEDDDWIFGPIPSPGMVVETREPSTRCTTFEVEDPQTLRTPALRKGDILDIDVLIDNPSKHDIARARAWLSYDPNMLEGFSVEIDENFPVVTPDEEGFSEDEGYVKMEATAENDLPNTDKILFARVQLRVKETNAIGTPITFYDPQPSGHTVIMASEADEEVYVQKEEPGTLLVTFVQDGTPPPTENTPGPDDNADDSDESIFDNAPAEPDTDDAACLRDSDCENGACVAGQCRELSSKKANGEACSFDSECESGICGSGTCVPALGDSANDNDSQSRTAFSLLQIRNVRVTTDGTAVFLAWDHLQSSQLKAYNVYYGTTTGRYIQRRTIDKSENSITLRSLSLGEEYFLAVRGLSVQDEESAFSREVSIIVGDPDSSTAPLVAGSISRGPTQNPVGDLTNQGEGLPVPGETGASSVALLFLLGSAIIGTTFASRRQLVVSATKPDNE